jgi:two-component system, chemotaxis family, CheB/CheR fusion protein
MSEDDPRLEPLLEYLKSSRGFDFTAYKRSSLDRRIQKRMQAVNVASYEDYRDYLDRHPEEFGLLFNTILINVTSFFRDPEAWRFLAAEIVPRIVANSRPEGVIRVWSAGCASGEEPFSLAIVLAEHLGVDGFHRRVKIYASDVDEDALMTARHGTYSPQQVEEVPPDLLARYFERVDDRYLFHKELRRSIIFGRHDLIQDAPISRCHLISCRNTLMYFTREAQSKVLARFHFALRPGGFLFMGRAELLLTHGALFTPVDPKWRVFTKTPESHAREQFGLSHHEQGSAAIANDDRIQTLLVESDPLARMVVRADGRLVLASARARALFRLGPQDMGKLFQDLELSYKPVELRSIIQEAITSRRAVSRRDVPYLTDSGETVFLELAVAPLVDASGETVGAQVTFMDMTQSRHLQQELERSKKELETAYEELQSTNEELETTNEELQSTNEELETTNEELQSTNEELETMNEELQSTNEELETTNTELQVTSGELDHVNAFLASILEGLEAAVIVVDPTMQVLSWNHGAEEMWGLRTDEVKDRHLMNLDIGLPVEQLRTPIRSVLAREVKSTAISLDCTNRRGKAIRCKIRGTPLKRGTDEVLGVILLIEEPASSS